MDEEGNPIRPPDTQRVDRLIPDEEEIIDEDLQTQMFLLEQQLLLKDFERRKSSQSTRGRQQTTRQADMELAAQIRHRKRRNLIIGASVGLAVVFAIVMGVAFSG